jgi:hypothetical protein
MLICQVHGNKHRAVFKVIACAKLVGRDHSLFLQCAHILPIVRLTGHHQLPRHGRTQVALRCGLSVGMVATEEAGDAASRAWGDAVRDV